MSSDPSTTILWDIDGTLLVAGDGGLEHYYRAIADVVPGAPAPVLSTHGKTDWQVISEFLVAASLPASHAQAMSRRLDELSVDFLDKGRLQLLPGVEETLDYFAQRGVANGLLTGNSELRSRNKLGGAGLELELIDWTRSFFGFRAARRADITRAARQRFPGGRLLIVGDTPFDGHAAAEAGIPFIAVCTGTYGRSDFEGIASIGILDTLSGSDISEALSRLG